MNRQSRFVFRNAPMETLEKIEAARKLKIAEILAGRVANDHEDFERLKSERQRKINARK
jgi:hypothetical protein